MQEQPRVLAHGAGDIEERDNRWLLGARTEELQIDQRSARLQAGPQGTAHVDDVAMRMRREAARLDLVEWQDKPLDRRLGSGDFGRRHLGEILLLEKFTVRNRQAGIDFDILAFAFEFLETREQRILDPLRARPGLILVRWRHLRDERGEELVEIVATAKEDAERLVEQLRMLVPLYEHRM